MKTLLFTCIFFLTLSVNLFAENLKNDLMQIHANLIPKIMMMDYDFSNRLVDDAISIAIVYENIQQKNDALELQRYMKVKYPDGISGHAIHLDFIAYKNVDLSLKHSFYYLLPSSEKNIKQALKVSNRQKALSFAYNSNDLQYGVMLSVKITNKVKPMINVDALKKTEITVRPILLKVAEIYFQQALIMNQKYDKYSLHIV